MIAQSEPAPGWIVAPSLLEHDVIRSTHPALHPGGPIRQEPRLRQEPRAARCGTSAKRGDAAGGRDGATRRAGRFWRVGSSNASTVLPIRPSAFSCPRAKIAPAQVGPSDNIML